MSVAILSLKSEHQLASVNMADQASDPVFSCDVCGKTCLNQNALSKHKNTLRVHEGLRRNEKNEIEFVCNVCDKVFKSRLGFYKHHCTKHRANVDALAESTEVVIGTTPVKVEDEYESDGNESDGNESDGNESDGNEISHEKECVVEISTSMALGNIQDSVKRAFRNLVDEMVPLYVASGVEQMDAWYRVRAKTESFENELLMTLMQDTFKIAGKMKRDLAKAVASLPLTTTDEPMKKRRMKESDWNASL